MTTDPLQAAPLTAYIGDRVRKTKGYKFEGRVCGIFSYFTPGENGVAVKYPKFVNVQHDDGWVMHFRENELELVKSPPPASVVSAPAPGELSGLVQIIEAHVPFLRFKPPSIGISHRTFVSDFAADILSQGYRKSLPTAEVVEELAVVAAEANLVFANEFSSPDDHIEAHRRLNAAVITFRRHIPRTSTIREFLQGYRKPLPTAEVVELREALKATYGFWNDVRDYYCDAGTAELDGGDFQNLAEKHGLMQSAVFDPEKHKGIDDDWDFELEAGDMFYERTALERRAAAATHPTPTAPLGAQVTDKTEAWDMREKGEGE